MKADIRSRKSHVLRLGADWTMHRSNTMAAATPNDVDWSGDAVRAQVPGTVAASLADESSDRTMLATQDIDAFDWWYRTEFAADVDAHDRFVLWLHGLATIAEVWLNGVSIHRSRNMFREFRVDVSSEIRAQNTLCIAFRSVTHDLGKKRKRPGWKTNLVNHQQLRWVRTSLMGRVPGWTDPVPAIGPWRAIEIEQSTNLTVDYITLLPQRVGGTNTAKIKAAVACDQPTALASPVLEIGEKRYPLVFSETQTGLAIDQSVELDELEPWYPTRFGTPALHDYKILATLDDNTITLHEGRTGFRQLDVNRDNGDVCFNINGLAVFARGACWTPGNMLTLVDASDELRHCLQLFRDAGGNMIRVGGTMVYETDEFYSLCDELGICVWQDFMFANMDYPSTESEPGAEFVADAMAEVTAQIARLSAHPCVVAFTGNSEVEQQACMFGRTEEDWQNPLFYDLIPRELERQGTQAGYFTSSPSAGALPMSADCGPSHYFGVGAYRQSLGDLQKSDVRFASECLAFANVPADSALREHFGSTAPAVHEPRWKAGVPRDSAAGWDFEDVRDHYLKAMFDHDAMELRYADKDRYIALSQVVSGEVMHAAYAFWQSSRSACNGALIWFLRDIAPGAGWGFIDSDGNAKPAWYFLKRAWSDLRVSVVDCGMNGVSFCINNERSTDASASLSVMLLQHSKTVIATAEQTLSVPAGGETDVRVDKALGRFLDPAYRHRFGPAKHDVVLGVLQQGDVLVECAAWFPNGAELRQLDAAEVSVSPADNGDDGSNTKSFTIRSDAFLQNVKLVASGYDFDDNFFHLPPGIDKQITATPKPDTARNFRGKLSALNLGRVVQFS